MLRVKIDDIMSRILCRNIICDKARFKIFFYSLQCLPIELLMVSVNQSPSCEEVIIVRRLYKELTRND